MKAGQSKEVDVPAKDAYGERDPEAIIDVPRNEFPDDVPLKPGIELQMQNMDGDILNAVVMEVNDNNVKLDFNHPLAGRELHFDVKVVSLREATQEELEHGHVHGDYGEEDEDYDEEDDDLEDFDEDEDLEESDFTDANLEGPFDNEV